MQTSKNILLIKPSNFVFNNETSISNAFQIKINLNYDEIKIKVLEEFERFANTLISKGVNVIIFEDTELPKKPDAIFPNNWVSMHNNGEVIIYPMCAVNRRTERRFDIIESLNQKFILRKITDISFHEKDNKFLEGTGSIVFDHVNKIAYSCLSIRTEKNILVSLCNHLQYKPIYFHSYDINDIAIYHTNVMMCIGEKFAVICLDSITNVYEKEILINSFIKTGHQIIEITQNQMKCFAGNMIELQTNNNKSILVLSKSAYDSLTDKQINVLETYIELVPVSINTIETIGGGSVRCMIAEIFLDEK